MADERGHQDSNDVDSDIATSEATGVTLEGVVECRTLELLDARHCVASDILQRFVLALKEYCGFPANESIHGNRRSQSRKRILLLWKLAGNTQSIHSNGRIL